MASESFTYPAPEPGGWQFFPYYLAADSTNHIAAVMLPEKNPPCGTRGPAQLASFTINSNGSLTSTNTWQNMPTPTPSPNGGIVLAPISPSGKVLAIAVGSGVQFFHFNGGRPITKFTAAIAANGLLTSMQWDNNNHLYGVDSNSGRLHVYAVTSTGVVEAAGSSYAIGAKGLIVVPK